MRRLASATRSGPRCLRSEPWRARYSGRMKRRGPQHSAPRTRSGCARLAEYRLEELARISGVSARNIRAYRERGLLDPPRRVGRSAFYDDYQLIAAAHDQPAAAPRASTRLTSPSFSRACVKARTWQTSWASSVPYWGPTRRRHIEDASGLPARSSTDVRRRRRDRAPSTSTRHSRSAARLIEYGLAEMRGGRVVVVDPAIAEILGRTADQLLYVRALLRIYESTRDAVDGLAGGFVRGAGGVRRGEIRQGPCARGGRDRRTGPDRPGLPRSVGAASCRIGWTSHCSGSCRLRHRATPPGSC